MTVRCDYSDLPEDQCGHCKGVDLADVLNGPPPARWEGSQTEARFPGNCGHCGKPFAEGTLIVAADVDGNGASDEWCIFEHTVGAP